MTKQTDIDAIKTAVEIGWPGELNAKARRYVGKFFAQTRNRRKIVAKVEGNHGTYTVSIEVKNSKAESACSCYIGSGGYCHHCHALARTFLNDPASFKATTGKKLGSVKTLEDLEAYLKGVTLDSLLQDMKAQGISGKAFAESIGMNPRHLSSIKSSELRNRFYNELGATKLACLWMIEHFKKVA